MDRIENNLPATPVVETPLPKKKRSWVARPIKKPESTRWKMYFNRLLNYAKDRGWTVLVNSKVDMCLPLRKEIYIKKGKRLPETRVYILMHELGHMLLFSRYGDYLNVAKQHKISPRSYAYVMYEIEQEIDAWRCGLDIGESLKVPVSAHHYEMVKARSLSIYLQTLLERRIKRIGKRAITEKQVALPLVKLEKLIN